MTLLAILAAAAIGAPAASEDAFQAFKDFCVQTGGDVSATAAAATRAGWKMPAEEALQKLAAAADDPQSVQVRVKRTLAKPNLDGFMILSANRSSFSVRGEMVTANHCQLTFTPGDYAAVLALAKAWAAVPETPSPDPAKGRMFVFADENGRHTVMTKAEIEGATAQVTRSRRITQFTVYNLSRGPSLRLDIPVP